MDKLILTHRWGTSAQWLASKVIPAQNQLVIELCENGERKFKLGDGKKLFKDLPYTDRQLVQQLAVEKARIDAIMEWHDGGEMPDISTVQAQVYDARLDYQGQRHANLGTALRVLGEQTQNLKTGLADFMNGKAVDGLYYENNMLYLTAKDQVLQHSGVQIKAGSGGGGAGANTKVRITNKTALGTRFSVVKGSQIPISFIFTSTEDDMPTGSYTATIEVNGAKKAALTLEQRVDDNGQPITEVIDLKEYLVAAENTVKLTCTDVYGSYRTIVYNIQLISLAVRSLFNSNVVYQDRDQKNKYGIDFRYIADGLIRKIVEIKLDGNTIHTEQLSAASSGSELGYIIPWSLLSHGCHTLRIQSRAIIDAQRDLYIYSQPVIQDILCYRYGETAPMIGSTFETTQVYQGDLISIPYLVFHPGQNRVKVRLAIYTATYDQRTEQWLYSDMPYTSSQLQVPSTLQTWSTRNYPIGQKVKFSILYYYGSGQTQRLLQRSHVIRVREPKISILPEDGARLNLSASGRDNGEANPANWSCSYKVGQTDINVTTAFTGFNWKSNGWVADAKLDKCLRLSGGAYADINYKLFDPANYQSGFTFEIDFAVRDVNNRDTVAFSCYAPYSGKVDQKGNSIQWDVGIKATADTAFIATESDKVSCNYKDEQRLKLVFTIDPIGTIDQTTGACTSDRLLSVYLNGVLSKVVSYTSQSFNQAKDLYLRLGDSRGGCTVDVYGIRAYAKTLTHNQIVNNYLADISDIIQKQQLFDANDIYTIAGLLDYESVVKRVPTIIFTGDMPTYKGDKKLVTMDFINPYDQSRSFSNVYGGPIQVEIDVQGTSSQWYVRKNWKIKLKKKKDGVTIFNHAPYQHMEGEVPSQVFCIKVDYAEATGTHNTQNANYVETLYQDFDPIPPQKADSRVRTTITGFPCVIYQRKTQDHQPVFSSKGNFNYDKDSQEAFGFSGDRVECWEFCNNTSDVCLFTGNFQNGGRDYWLDDFEPRYTSKDFDRLEELQDALKEAQKQNKDAQLSPAEMEQLRDLRQDIIANFKQLHDWVVSTKNDLAKFKAQFNTYFDLQYTTLYYVYSFFALMTDQRAKNLFLTCWMTNDENGNTVKKWYPYFYDNDTSYGINNEGQLVFDYYHEDTDLQTGGAGVYNGYQSTLWNNFRQAFPAEIANMYASLRSSKKLTYQRLIDQFITKGSQMWSASIYNEDAQYKYITMARWANAEQSANQGETGKLMVNRANLYQVRGDGQSHLKYFVSNRIKYCDSKWNAGDYPNDYVLLRLNTPKVEQFPAQESVASGQLTLNTGDNTFGIVGPKNKTVVFAYKLDQQAWAYAQTYTGQTYDASANLGYGNITITSQTQLQNVVFEIRLDDQASEEFTLRELTGSSYPSGATQAEKEAIDQRNAIIQATIQAVPPSPAITVTPYSDMYCGVRYKANGTLFQSRTTKNQEKVFGADINETFNDTETAIFGASQLSSLGDLSALYCSVLDTSAAKKLTNLQVGSHKLNYRNLLLREINVGANPLLKTIDITNCAGLSNSLNLANCPNIEQIYCGSTSISGISLPNAGFVKTLVIPASISKLVLTNHPNLTTNNLVIGGSTRPTSAKQWNLSSIRQLVVDNCSGIDTSAMFADLLAVIQAEKASNGTAIRRNICLTNVTIFGKSVDWLRSLYSEDGYNFGGLNPDGTPLTKGIYLTGTCQIDQDVEGAIMAEIVDNLPYLTFVMKNGHKIKSTVTFKDYTGNHILHTQEIQSSSTVGVICPDPIEAGYIATPHRENTPKYAYTFSGWSRYATLDRTAQEDALQDILGDRTLYAAFSMQIRSYPVNFYTAGKQGGIYKNLLLYTQYINYGESWEFDSDLVNDSALLNSENKPKNMASTSPDAYIFTGWSPNHILKVEGDLDLYAQFSLKTSAQHGTILDDFQSNYHSVDNTLIITKYPAKQEPQTILLLNTQYSGTHSTGATLQNAKLARLGISSFEQSPVQYLRIQNRNEATTAKSLQIADYALASCQNLSTLILGSTIDKLGFRAFYNCRNIAYMYYNIPEATIVGQTSALNTISSRFPFSNFAQGDRSTSIEFGPQVIKIPNNLFYHETTANMNQIYQLDFTQATSLTSIGTSAFNNCQIANILFAPTQFGLSIAMSAFGGNKVLTQLRLPRGIASIGTAAFDDNISLRKVSLPNSLITTASPLGRSMQGAFRGCTALTQFELELDSPFLYKDGILYSNAYGDSTSNRAVIFAATGAKNSEQLDESVTEILPYAFSESLITAYTVPPNVKQLPNDAFAGCTRLVTLTLPQGLTKLQDQCLYQCTKLQALTFPSTLEAIDTNALFNCQSIQELKLPQACSSLGINAFYGCINLKKLTIESTNTKVATTASSDGNYKILTNCSSLTEITVGWTSDERTQVNGWKWEGDTLTYCWDMPQTTLANLRINFAGNKYYQNGQINDI